MYITSDAYKREQKQELREKSYVYIYMGLINLYAREKATVLSGLTDYSNLDSAFREKHQDSSGQYATLEENFTRVDDYNAFLPRNSAFYSDSQGLVTSAINGAITITFADLVDVDTKGLTIDFGNEYPTQFTVTNGTTTMTYDKTDSSLFSCEDQFDDCTYLTITPVSMVGGQQRLRIHSMEFGVGLSFDNDSIISTQRRNSVSHLSDTLPLKNFDFTIDNLTRRFSQDNPKSFADYIQQGQKVEYNYGRDIADSDGNIVSTEIIPGGVTYIKTWSSTDMQAKFSTVGRLDLLDTEYYKGQIYDWYSDEKTLYDIAIDVLTDAGLTSDEYEVSGGLKNRIVQNPLPIATHKACLQMIASASKSVLYENREGKVCLQISALPSNRDMMKMGTDIEYYSDEVFFENQKTYNYASLEEGYTRVDNKLLFMSRSDWNSPSLVTKIGGGTIRLMYFYEWSSTGLRLVFSEILPTRVLIEYGVGDNVYDWDDWTKKGEIELTDVQYNTFIQHEFKDFNDVRITFEINDETVNPLVDEFDNTIVNEDDDIIGFVNGSVSRVHVEHIAFTLESGYTIGNIDLKEKPTATSVDLIKDINVEYYSLEFPSDYSSDYYKQLTSVAVTYNSEDVGGTHNIIKLSNIAKNYRVLWDDGTEDWSESKTYSLNAEVKYQGIKYRSTANNNTGYYPSYGVNWTAISVTGVSIAASGAYYVDALVTVSPTYKLLVYGTQATVKSDTVTERLHDIGNSTTLKNQLIDRYTWADNILEHIKEYNNSNTEYTIQYRGEPALECDDLVYLENQFVYDNLCRIEEEELSTSVGMSLTNSMKLRRVSYGEIK